MFNFFSTLKPAKDPEVDFEIIDLVLGLLEASKSTVFLSFWSFAKIHGPNIAFVEGLMKARGDLVIRKIKKFLRTAYMPYCCLKKVLSRN